MRGREWTDREIEQKAKSIAAAIRKVAARARNEAELRIGVNPILREFAEEVGFEVDDQHEVWVGRGLADSVYGRVVIEYKAPGTLGDRRSAPNQRAVEQIQNQLEGKAKQEGQALARLVGVVFDGARMIFVRRRREEWDVASPREVDKDSVADLLLRMRALRGKALLPDNLVADFGGVEARGKFTASPIAERCVSALYKALSTTDSRKVEALFGQWRLLFSEVCGYEFGSAKLDLEGLAGSYGVMLKPTRRVGAKREKQQAGRGGQAERLFFCIHTYYATLLTLLAAEIVTYYMATYLPSYLGKLEELHGERLRKELEDLHTTGGIFGQVGVQNFLEGDFFGWYLEAWTEEVGSAVQALLRALRLYDPATFQVAPDETRDLLKKLYQYLLPKKLRHDLGEYYTPDWLAELVLEEVGYDGDVTKRILDPACGSGTFLVLEIKRAKDWARGKPLGDRETLEGILQGIVGFDLNPLAVITARTNYLIALGELLRHRATRTVEIPVYLCDAIRAPSEYGRPTAIRTGDLLTRVQRVETSVGDFDIPLGISTRESVSALSGLLEEAIRGHYRAEVFLDRAKEALGVDAATFADSEECLRRLYGKLCQVDAEGRNGIWARIIRNFFAPVFTVAERKFDYLAGNLPWINWESLPDQYRDSTKGLWEDYGLFTLKGWRARMGGGKKDLSALFLYVAADRYLRDDGLLSFLVTESLFKTSGAGEGFRRFELPVRPGERKRGLRVKRVHDLVEVAPFEGASNRTAVITATAGGTTRYPVAYTVWRKKQGMRIDEGVGLAYARSATDQREEVAAPITARRGAPWVTGPANALEAIRKVVGKSGYRAAAGACTWMNGVYWLRVLEKLPEGLLLVENLPDTGKADVRQVRARLEIDLVYPLLRGADVMRWRAEAKDWILMVQDPSTRKGYDEDRMRRQWPLTYAYLGQFEDELRGRSGFRKYFNAGDPFYSIYNVGPTTFARVKVVWPQMIPELRPAVVGELQRKVVIPQHIVTLVPFAEDAEAHYFCGALASAPATFIGMRCSTGKSFGAPHVLDHIRVPQFDARSQLHLRLADLSEAAHEAAAKGEKKRVAEIEGQVDEAAAELWGLTAKELAVIQKALRDKQRGGRGE